MEKVERIRWATSYLTLSVAFLAALLSVSGHAAADGSCTQLQRPVTEDKPVKTLGTCPMVSRTWKVPETEGALTASETDDDPPIYYGWQTLLVDAVWIGTAVTAFVLESPELAGVSAGVAVLGPPVVHLAHGNVHSAAISVGIRLGAGILLAGGLALVLTDASDDASDDSSADGVLGGVLALAGAAGVVGAVVVDAAFLAFTVQDSSESVRLLPWLQPQTGDVGVRLTGRL